SDGSTMTPGDSISFPKLLRSRSAIFVRRLAPGEATIGTLRFPCSTIRRRSAPCHRRRAGNVGPECAFALLAFTNIEQTVRKLSLDGISRWDDYIPIALGVCVRLAETKAWQSSCGAIRFQSAAGENAGRGTGRRSRRLPEAPHNILLAHF